MTEKKETTQSNHPGKDPEITISRSHKWIVLIAVTLIISAVGLPAVWFIMPPGFVTTGAIRISPVKEHILFRNADSEKPMPNYESFKSTQAESFKGDDILHKAADKLADETIIFFDKSGDVITGLRNALDKSEISVKPAENSELIILKMKSKNIQQSQKIINTFIDVYMEKVKEEERSSGDEITKLLFEQRDSYEKQIEQQQELIRQLTAEYGTQQLNPRQKMMLKKVERLQAELIEVNIKKIYLEAKLGIMQDSPEVIVDPVALLEKQNEIINSDPEIEFLNENIRKYELLVLESEYSLNDGQPELKKLKSMLTHFHFMHETRQSELAEMIKAQMQTQVKYEHEQKLDDLRKELLLCNLFEEKFREKLQDQDTDTRDIGRKQFIIDDEKEKLQRTKGFYHLVSQRLEELRVEDQRPGRIEIARYANSVPAKAVSGPRVQTKRGYRIIKKTWFPGCFRQYSVARRLSMHRGA